MAANYLHKRYPKMSCTLHGDLDKEIENVFTQGNPRLEEYDGKLQRLDRRARLFSNLASPVSQL